MKKNKPHKQTSHQLNVDRIEFGRLLRIRKAFARLSRNIARNSEVFDHISDNILAILNAGTLRDLVALLHMTPRAQSLPTKVAIVLCDPKHEIRNLLSRSNCRSEDLTGVIFEDSLSDELKVLADRTSPWLGPCSKEHQSRFFSDDGEVKSVAILSLRKGDALNGLLVWGSNDPGRYTADQATDFAAFTSKVIATSIENMINRDRLRWISVTDALTGWFNRRHMEEALVENLRHAAKCRQAVSVVMFDLDHFKKLNDEYGHDVGDQILRQVTSRAKEQVRPTDVCTRYGGEEFLIVVPRTRSSDAGTIAEKLCRAISSSEFDVHGKLVAVSVSVGISTLNPEQDSDLRLAASKLVKAADGALYEAKKRGRNQVVVSANQ